MEDLSTASFREAATHAYQTPGFAKMFGEQVAFLSHSHDDKRYAKGLQALLKEQGWRVYLDWEDGGMPDTPSRETGLAVQKRIQESDWLLYLATPNSANSRWCPWEIGYADRALGIDRVIIIPTTDRTGNHHGQEYLRLYRQINVTRTGKLARFEPGALSGTLVESL